jgi:anaerobic dimethyl sulfoxide reductase subunit B (iron-sulfur subunit)
MNQMGFYFDQTRCTGCYTCVVACKDWHDIKAGGVQRMRIIPTERGVFPDLFVAYLALACCHCENPPCATVCPVNAISKRKTDGIVLVERDKCVGSQECHAPCLKACPWDTPQFDADDGGKMEKCDFCLDRLEKGQQTICVEACPTYALDAGPLMDLVKKYRHEVEAVGFSYQERFRPSILFKPKANRGHCG